VITPTRELAYQIFETLPPLPENWPTRYSRLSPYQRTSLLDIRDSPPTGLVIGVKDLQFEWRRVCDCNILVCTPGRLLQHLDQNPDNLVLDLGFSTAIISIVSALPPSRQTLLFSATQTAACRIWTD